MENKIYLTQEGKEEIEAIITEYKEYNSNDNYIQGCNTGQLDTLQEILDNSEVINPNHLIKTNRELALEWWNKTSNEGYQFEYCYKLKAKYNIKRFITESEIEEIYKREVQFEKSTLLKRLCEENEILRNEVIKLLKFFIKDTRGDKPFVDADDEWVSENI
jgi:hypothetical protein